VQQGEREAQIVGYCGEMDLQAGLGQPEPGQAQVDFGEAVG
jgi:hypothetical protein